MNKNHLILCALFFSLLAMSCSSDTKKESAADTKTPTVSAVATPASTADLTKGVGRFTNVALTSPLDQKMIAKGSDIFDIKCGSCHKLTDEKLVGPGWKGVTDRHKPEWIMNFVTNTEEMLNKDPNAQALLEKCMVRMPNQNLKDDEARQILEFMRKNDGKN